MFRNYNTMRKSDWQGSKENILFDLKQSFENNGHVTAKNL